MFFYTNAMDAAISPYDVSMKFMRNVPAVSAVEVAAGAEAAFKSAQSLTVSMSPSHAKAMLPALIRLVSEYEKKFGAIPLPEDAQNFWDATFPNKAGSR